MTELGPEILEAITLEHDILKAIQDMIDEPSRIGSNSLGGCLLFKSKYLQDYKVAVRMNHLVIDRLPISDKSWTLQAFSLADPNCFDDLVKKIKGIKLGTEILEGLA